MLIYTFMLTKSMNEHTFPTILSVCTLVFDPQYIAFIATQAAPPLNTTAPTTVSSGSASDGLN